MLEIQGHPTRFAVATWTLVTGLVAEKELAEPKSKPLLAYAPRTVDEHAGWE